MLIPDLEAMRVLAAFIYSAVIGIGWCTGCWVTRKVLK